MSIVGSNALAGASGQSTGGDGGGGGGFRIDRSLRFNDGDSAYLNRTPSSAGNRKTWTWSGWLKRSGLGVLNQLFVTQSSGTAYTALYIDSSNKLRFEDYESSAQSQLITTQVFRDVSAWQHIVVAVDTTQATASNRVKLYVNGQQVTEFDTETYMSQNRETYINNTVDTRIGGGQAANQFLNGYLAEVHFIDGQALAATDFGEFDTSNVWNPKQFEGTYNTAASFSSYPGVTISPSAVGGGSVSHVNGGGTYFYSQASSGAGSIKVEFSSPITGVTSIKYNGGGYSVNSAYNIRINGVDVFTNLSTNSSWAQASHTISSTDISSFEIWTANDGWSLYNLLFNDVSPSGTASLGTPAGVNGFHLDFSDNSRNAALGTDRSSARPGVDFDGTGDHLESADHADYSFGTNDFTIEFFLNPREFVNYDALVMKYAGNASNSSWWMSTNSSGHILFYLYYGSSEMGITTSGTGMNLNKWNHVACVRDGSTVRVYINGLQVGTGSFSTNSVNDSATALRIGEDSTGAYDLNGVMSNVRIINGTCLYTNGTTFTVPSTPLANVTNTKLLCCQSSSSATAAEVSPNSLTVSGNPFATQKGNNDFTVNNLAAAGSAWDQSQTWSSLGTGTAYNSAYDWDKAFNGVITTTTDNAFGASDATMTWTPSSAITVNTSVTLYVYNPTDGSSYGTRVNGSYITGTNNYNVAVTLTAATLGGQLTSIQLTNSGLVGPYLGGVEVDGLLLVDAGIADTAAPNIDSLIDTPTNYTADSGNNGGNYPTWNPLSQSSSTFSNGNLQATTSGGSGYPLETVNFYTPPGTGKWYWEFQLSALSGSNYTMVGMLPRDNTYVQGNSNIPTEVGGIQVYIGSNGAVTAASGAATAGTATATFGVGDILGWAFDAGNGTVQCYKNGVAQGTQFTNVRTDVGWAFCATDYDNSATATYIINFGQRPFAISSTPTGHVSLCTTNLPDPTIADGSAYMDVILWTGQGNTNDRTLTTTTSADLVWTKSRSNAYHHALFDTVRGFSQNGLNTDSNNSEGAATGGYLKSVTDTSITLAATSDNSNAWYNGNAHTYVAWLWDAGSSNTSISAGGLNSSIYDRSKVWTSLVTTSSLHSSYNSYGPTSKLGAFDGKQITSMYSASGPLTITFDASAFPASGGPYFVEVETNQRGIKVNGQPSSGYTTDIASGQATYWANNGSVSSLTSVEINQASGAYGGMTNRIRVNGKVLADSINNNVTWSNSLSGLSGSSLTNPTNAFDTDESTYADSTAGFTLDLSGHTFGTGAHTIEVKSGGATSFTVNSYTSLTDPGGGGAKVWTGTHTGELTSLASSATGASVYYIKIDGEYLADPGQDFVTNFPSIASTVRANPSTGVSIVSYTGNGTNGATVGHGLNSKPDLILLKTRGDTQNWMVYHSALGATKAVFLSTTDSAATSSVYFSNTEPTSSVFSLGTRAGINQNSDPMIAYCFSAVDQYSAFGKFSGNSSTDGPFQYCGFKPRFLLLKGVTQARNWIILDTARDAGNVGDSYLHPDSNGAESTYAIADILSNGFKMRYNGGLANQTGEDYVWAAFASHPFKTARAR